MIFGRPEAFRLDAKGMTIACIVNLIQVVRKQPVDVDDDRARRILRDNR